MSAKYKILCFECTKYYGTYRCAKCGHIICKKCAVKLGGGAWNYPTCPSCKHKSWVEA